MIEAQLKKDYALGNIKGITDVGDYFYMPVRITGSGLNIRKQGEALIVADRNKTEFFNEAFIDHCKSLPIIIEHPVDDNGNKDMLNNDTLPKNAIIGNTIDAWIAGKDGDEVWGLARIYDKTLLEKIKDGEINSTSPGVRIYYKESDPDFKTEVPYIINHLAFCEMGHWDKPDSIGFDNSKFQKIDLTFDSNFDMLQKNKQEEVSMVTEKIDAEKTEEATKADKEVKANDSTFTENAKEALAEAKAKANDDATSNPAAEASKSNPAEEATKKQNKKANDSEDGKTSEDANVSKSQNSADYKEKDKGEKADDSDIGLAQAASLMAKASHAGLAKKEENPVEKEIIEKETSKTDKEENPKDEKTSKADADDKPAKTTDSDEAIDSENETEDDKKRDNEIKEMRKVCDSADANLGVKMPFISGRQTYRAVAHKFIQANKQFLDKKYENLALDSYTPELAKEVLQSVYGNIRKASKLDEKQVKVGGYIQMPDGSLCDPDF